MSATRQPGAWRPNVPSTLDGRYALVFEIEALAYGVLYAARDLETGEPVAVTVFHPAFFSEGYRRKNLERLRRTQKYRHPNLASIRFIAEQHAPVYVVADPVEGQPLTLWRRDGQTAAVAAAASYRIVGQIIDALAAVHRHGVHGALGPSTLRVAAGQAWLSNPYHLDPPPELSAGELPALRAAWLAPEQLYDVSPEGPPTDVYAVGLVLGFLLARGLTEPGHSLMVQGLDVPPQLDEVYVRATARQPELRYATMGELRQALEGAIGPAWGEAQVALTGPLFEQVAARGAAPAPAHPSTDDTPFDGIRLVTRASVGDDLDRTVEEEAIPAKILDVTATAEALAVPLHASGIVDVRELDGLEELPPPLPGAAEVGLPAPSVEAVWELSPPTPPPLPLDASEFGFPRPVSDTVAGEEPPLLLEDAYGVHVVPPSVEDTSERLAVAAGGDSWALDRKSLSDAVRERRPIEGAIIRMAGPRSEPVATGALATSVRPASELAVTDVNAMAPPIPPPSAIALAPPAVAPRLPEMPTRPAFAGASPGAALPDAPPGRGPATSPAVGKKGKKGDKRGKNRTGRAAVAGDAVAGPTAAAMAVQAAPVGVGGGPRGELERAGATSGARSAGAGLSARPDSPLTRPTGRVAGGSAAPSGLFAASPDPGPRSAPAVRPAEPASVGVTPRSTPPRAAGGRGGKRALAVAAAVFLVAGGVAAALLFGGDGGSGPGANDTPDASGAGDVVGVVAAADVASATEVAAEVADAAALTPDAGAAVPGTVEDGGAGSAADAEADVEADAVDALDTVDTVAADAGPGPTDDAAGVEDAGASEDSSAEVAADTVAPADTAAALADGGGAVADFVAKDWKKLNCPGGMAKLRKAIKVTLADGRQVDDWEVSCIDRYESPGAGQVPQVDIDLAGARAACAGRGKRLCTRTEWRRGCGGKYPYGRDYDPSACNTVGADGMPLPLVAAGAKSACRGGPGTFDMVGNVAEWTSEGFVNGGSAYKHGENATCSQSSRRAGGHPYVGFRCCADAK